MSGSRGVPKNRVGLPVPILGTRVLLFYILYCRLFLFLSVTYSGRLDNSRYITHKKFVYIHLNTSI